MRSRAAIVLIAAFAAPLPVAGAQEPPADVAAAFFAAVAEERWRDAARLLDLAAFDRYRRERIAAARLPDRRRPPPTAEALMRQDPNLPRAVAEYQALQYAVTLRDVERWVEREYAGVLDLDSLAALSAEEAAARWLQARDLRWGASRAAEAYRERGCSLPPGVGQQVPSPQFAIVATAVADSTTAYVLFRDALRRMRADPDPDAAVHEPAPRLMLLRRRSGRWRILPREGMLHGPTGVHFPSADCRRDPPPR